MNDPFRPADNWSECPNCRRAFGWNKEDGLSGQTCSCGHAFTGREQRVARPEAPIDDDQIRALHAKAVKAGDGACALLCFAALAGDPVARKGCQLTIEKDLARRSFG